MFDSFLAHALVLLMLFISDLRIFYIREPRVDCAAAVSPFAFLISLLIFPIWGFTIQSFVLCIVAGLTFLTNVRAIFRLKAELYVEHYSIPFKIATVLEFFMAIACAVFIIYFRPVRIVPKDFNVDRNVINLDGNFTVGFRLHEKLPENLPENFDGITDELKKFPDVVKKVSGKINVYTPTQKIEWISSEDSIFNRSESEWKKLAEIEENNENNISETENAIENQTLDSNSQNVDDLPILVFVSTPFATVANYEPYFLFLAQKGFTVFATDFYSNDMVFFNDKEKDDWKRRRDFFIESYLKNPEEFKELKSKVKYYTKLGYEEVSRIVLELYGDEKKIFYITDGLTSEEIFAFSDKFSGKIAGIFQMDLIPEYKTSEFGFPEQTDLYFAWQQKIERDDEFFIPRYLSFKTINKILGLKTATPKIQEKTEIAEEIAETEDKNTENEISEEIK